MPSAIQVNENEKRKHASLMMVGMRNLQRGKQGEGHYIRWYHLGAPLERGIGQCNGTPECGGGREGMDGGLGIE